MGGRLVVVTAAVALATCASGAAPPSPARAGTARTKTPQLLAAGATATGASAMTTVEARTETTDAAPFRVAIYVPFGYRTNLTHAVGTQIGTASASLQALQISQDAIIGVKGGTLFVDTPSKYLANNCSPGTHAAVWLVHATVPGATIDIPVYVDPTTGADAAFGSTKLELCLPNPYEQAAPGTRAPLGAKIVDAKLALSAGIFTNPASPGTYVWRSVITPWTANGTTANASGAVETQSVVTIPSALRLKANVRAIRNQDHGAAVTNSVLLNGTLLENGQGVARAKVAFFAGDRSAGTATTGSRGSFVKRAGLRRSTSFRATATVPARETSCVAPLPAMWAPSGCVSATIAGYRIRSNAVSARPRRR